MNSSENDIGKERISALEDKMIGTSQLKCKEKKRMKKNSRTVRQYQ